jgi:hypothetical protein
MMPMNMITICMKISAKSSTLDFSTSASGMNFWIDLFNPTTGIIAVNEYCMTFNISALLSSDVENTCEIKEL